jgi:hypothetical protein
LDCLNLGFQFSQVLFQISNLFGFGLVAAVELAMPATTFAAAVAIAVAAAVARALAFATFAPVPMVMPFFTTHRYLLFRLAWDDD